MPAARLAIVLSLALVSCLQASTPDLSARLAARAQEAALDMDDLGVLRRVGHLDDAFFHALARRLPPGFSSRDVTRAARGLAEVAPRKARGPIRELADAGFFVEAYATMAGERPSAPIHEPTTAWAEQVAPDEPEKHALWREQILDLQQHFARKQAGTLSRAFHAKAHAGVRARFQVAEGLPTWAQRGAFRAPREYPAVVRFSNGMSARLSDRVPDTKGLAVKLLGVDGPLLDPAQRAGTQDFLAINEPIMPARNASKLMVLVNASKNMWTLPFKVLRGLGLWDSMKAARIILVGLSKPCRSVATQTYWSTVPIRFGPYAAKFKWVPRQGGRGRVRLWSSGNYLRRELAARLAEGPLAWDLMVQFFVDEEHTPIESAVDRWKARHAPFLRVGTLTVEPTDLASEQAQAVDAFVESLSFTPWHGLEEHRPLGSIQRARRGTYDASAAARGGRSEPFPEEVP